uniref:Uncharacterized protein n=1 Tax=Romanomermis culicivorax TaxID=13658 RepID=A0A915KQV6_ROMCU
MPCCRIVLASVGRHRKASPDTGCWPTPASVGRQLVRAAILLQSGVGRRRP